MTTITFDTLKAIEDLEAAGMDTRQAKAVVNTLADAFTDTVATKTDIAELRGDIVAVKADIDKLATSTRADLTEVKAELNQEIASTKANIAVLRADIWRIGISIAGGAVLLNKALDWLIR